MIWTHWLLGGKNLVEPERYRSFEPHLERDAATLGAILNGLGDLEAQFDHAMASIHARSRGYFTPDEDDQARQLLLSYRNFRLAIYSAVWRYVHYPREKDPVVQMKGFVMGFAAATMIFNKSLKLIKACAGNEIVRAKLNEPDARFGIEAGFFDDVVETYCSARYLALFAITDRFWRKSRKDFKRLGLEDDPVFGAFVRQARAERKGVWSLFGQTLRERMRHERRNAFKLLFAPVRATTYGAQTLLGHAVARMRTTLDYKPAIDERALDYLAPKLKSGDLLFTRTEHKATTALLPGFFGHVAIYVGSLQDAESLAMTHPAAQKALAAMRSRPSPRGWILEAHHAGVVVQTLEECLWCDHALAVRPKTDDATRKKALAEAFEHFGKPYDFDFDFARSSHVVCTELVYRMLHKKDDFLFSLTKRMGRYTLTVDDIVCQILTDQAHGKTCWEKVCFLTQWRGERALPLDPAVCSPVVADLLQFVAPQTAAKTAAVATAG